MTDRKMASIARKYGISIEEYAAIRYAARRRVDARKAHK